MRPKTSETEPTYHAELLNRNLLSKATNILIYLLPYRDSPSVEDSLKDLPFPVITTRRPFSPIPNRSVFPQDVGIVMDGILYATHENLEAVKDTFVESGLGWLFHGIKTSATADSYQGGRVAMSPRNRAAITSDTRIAEFLRCHQFRVGLLPSRSVRSLHKLHPGDWTYALPTHVDDLTLMYTDRGRSTAAVDETVKYSVLIDTSFPWRRHTVDHGDAQRGALNLAFLGRNHVLAPQDADGTSALAELRENGHRITFQPQEVVADNAGPKCRSLFLSLV